MVLLLYASRVYMNPSFEKLFAELVKSQSASFRAIDVSAEEEEEINKAINASNVIIVDELIVSLSLFTYHPRRYFCNAGLHNSYFPRLRDHEFYQRVFQRISEASALRVAIHKADLHGESDAFKFIERFDGVWWFYEGGGRDFHALPVQYRDAWMSDSANTVANYELVKSRIRIRIDVPFSLHEGEFASKKIPSKWQACVPGDQYATRKIVLEDLRAQGVPMAPFHETSRYINGISARLCRGAAISQWVSRGYMKALQWMQRYYLERTEVCYTDGSGYGYPIRKFFEIPALRGALTAYPAVGLQNYGFKDGENCLLTIPEDGAATIKRLLSDDGLRHRLVDNAYAMIWEKHRVAVRAQQLLACFHRLEKNTLTGARFVDGNFELF